MRKETVKENAGFASYSENMKNAVRKELNHSLRINELMQMIGEGFNPLQKLMVGDLIDGSATGIAAIALKHCVSSEITFDRTNKFLYWREAGKYAAQQILFAADFDTQLHYDSCGYIINPFYYYEMESSVINQYYGIGLGDGGCGIVPIQIIRHDEDIIIVKPATVADAQAYLVKKEWGGASRLPRMTARATAALCTIENSVLFYESTISKKGKEGTDYYILVKYSNPGLQSLNKIVANLESERLNKIHSAQHIFAKKLEKVAEIKKMQNESSGQLPNLEVKLKELSARCADNPVAKLSFVRIPSLELEFFNSTISLKDMLDWDLKAIEAEQARNLRSAIAESILTQLEQTVAKWEKFAPAYAAQKPKIDLLEGEITVYEDHAWIRLPSSEKIGAFDVFEPPFGSIQFKLVLDELEKRQKLHAESEEVIRQQTMA